MKRTIIPQKRRRLMEFPKIHQVPKLRPAMVPTLLTLANGVCGFAAIIVASRVHPSDLYKTSEQYSQAMEFLGLAGWLIFLGMVFDVLDGRFARMANVTSKFGAELDSLCDVITFGAAPAFLLLKLGPTPDQQFLYRVLFVAATSYVICTILRLARFNVESGLDEQSHQYFKGLPSPAAAGCLASVAILRYDFEFYKGTIDVALAAQWIAKILPFASIAIALLMVSTVSYPHFVNHILRGRRPFDHLVVIVILVIALALAKELSLVIAFWGFAIGGAALGRYRKPRGTLPTATPTVEEWAS